MITNCAYCGRELNSHAPLDNVGVPRNGDFGFCVNCGKFNKFMNGKMIEVDYDNLSVEDLKRMNSIVEMWEKNMKVVTEDVMELEVNISKVLGVFK